MVNQNVLPQRMVKNSSSHEKKLSSSSPEMMTAFHIQNHCPSYQLYMPNNKMLMLFCGICSKGRTGLHPTTHCLRSLNNNQIAKKTFWHCTLRYLTIVLILVRHPVHLNKSPGHQSKLSKYLAKCKWQCSYFWTFYFTGPVNTFYNKVLLRKTAKRNRNPTVRIFFLIFALL